MVHTSCQRGARRVNPELNQRKAGNCARSGVTASCDRGLSFLEQSAQRAEILGLVVHQFGIIGENLFAVQAAGDLKFVNRLRIEQVILAVIAPLILATRLELAVDLPVGECVAMTRQRFRSNGFKANALNP